MAPEGRANTMQALSPSKLAYELGLLLLKRTAYLACCLVAVRVLA